MEPSTPSDDSGGTFTCYRCGLSEHYDFKGKKTPYSRWIELNEDGYIMQDPFSTNRNDFLLLGSDCSVCEKTICQSPNCSVYYMKRFCLPCAQTCLNKFPSAVQARVRKHLEQK
ncbi:hypothetical protein R5R35_003024 [Gryllus longicercus]|uniref:Cysteine-rich DPF motif domain-containing protein 1 n=1 Tax=Gryllus longicercus TaxID=2509291 RepID=A0AAN9VPZ1_9ORTH